MGGVAKAVGKVFGGGGGGGGTTIIQGPDPAEARRQAEADAAKAANAKAADLARRRRQGSLLAAGGQAGDAQTSSVLAYGKGKLGE